MTKVGPSIYGLHEKSATVALLLGDLTMYVSMYVCNVVMYVSL